MPKTATPVISAAGDPAAQLQPAGESRAMSPLLASAFCFALSMAMHLPWLAITPLAGTEGHRIIPATAMVHSHWWLVLMLFDKPLMTKPPLHQWLIAISQILSGGGDSFNVGGPKALFFWRLPSAITGAAMSAALCWFAARWFGRRAGLISGLCAVGMIAIWGQSQVADIDATNTLATALTALCGIELLIVRPRRIMTWLIATSLAMAAMWMTKGPAGLPIVLGVWLWAAFVRIRESFTPQLSVSGDDPQAPMALAPSTISGVKFVVIWLAPVLIGVAMIGLWWYAARRSMVAHGFSIDKRGVQEGAKRLIAESPRALFLTLVWILPIAIVSGLPVTPAILLWMRRDVRAAMKPPARHIAAALAAATLISWGICVISGMPLPRYAYPTLVLLCPLASAVAVSAVKSRRANDWLGVIAGGAAVAFAVAAIVLAIGARHAVEFRLLLIGSCIIAIIIAVYTILLLPRSWNAAWGLVALCVCASIPFGVQRHWARADESAISTAPLLRKTIGENGVVAVSGAVSGDPEAFFYAKIRTNTFDLNDFLPSHVPHGTWIMLDAYEHHRWLNRGGRLQNDRKICNWGKTDYYLAWYP